MNTAGNILTTPSTLNQSQPASVQQTSAKNGAAEDFQSLLAGQMKQNVANENGLKELLDLLSGLDEEVLAELIALLGGVQNQTTAVEFSEHAPTLSNSDVQTQILGVGGSGFFLQGASRTAESGVQLRNGLFAILEQLNMSAEQLLSKVKEKAQAEKLPVKQALLDVIQSVSQTNSQASNDPANSLTMGRIFFPLREKLAVKPNSFPKQVAQIRPEIAALLDESTNPGNRTATEQFHKQLPISVTVPAGEQSVPLTTSSTVPDSQSNSGNLLMPTILPTRLGHSDSGLTASSRTVSASMTADQFKAEFQGMVIKYAELMERGGANEMKISLVPEGLGEVLVRVVDQGGQLTLQISADTQYARGLIDSGIGMLRQQLEAQGLQVNRIEVVPSSTNTAANFQQGMFEGQKQHQQQRNSNFHRSTGSDGLEPNFQFDVDAIYQEIYALERGQFSATV